MRVAFFDPYLDTLGGGERYTLTLACHLSQKHQVEIFWNNESIKKDIEERLALDLGQVKFTNNIFARGKDLLEKLIKTSRYDLIFYLSDGSIPSSLARKNILHFQTPFTHPNGKSFINKLKLSRFQWVVCNSYFTKKFIDKTYRVKSLVVYPPVDVSRFVPERKRNLILNVGRFTSFFESKKQEIMISTFKKMVDKGLKEWEFILIGGLLDKDKDYFDKLKDLSLNYPVKLLPNLSFNDLKRYYSEAKIYWHGNGYDEDEEKNPELFEHFGISTVEAMSAGCVPVVYNGGGQKEIVTRGENGFLWHGERELVDYTLKLVNDDNLRKTMSLMAIKKSKDFSKEVFLRRFDEIIAL